MLDKEKADILLRDVFGAKLEEIRQQVSDKELEEIINKFDFKKQIADKSFEDDFKQLIEGSDLLKDRKYHH